MALGVVCTRLASFRPRFVNAPDTAYAIALGLLLGRYHHPAALFHYVPKGCREFATVLKSIQLG